MGFIPKTTGVYLLLLSLLNGTAIAADTAAPEQAAQDSAQPESVEPQSTLVSELETALDKSIDDYRSAIAQREAEYGPFDAELSEMSYSLGKTLQHRHRFYEAMEAYHRAMYLKRVNNGVYSLSQEPMLRGIIASQSALGNSEAASESYQQLLWLYSKTYGDRDPHLIAIMDEVSRWHLRAYRASGRRDDVQHLHLARGLSTYAQEIAAEHYGELDLKQVALLQNTALANYYLDVHQQNYPGVAGFEDTNAMFERVPNMKWVPQELFWRRNFYQGGRRDCQKMIRILEKNPDATTADKARGYVAMGDWLLLFNHPDSAIKSYRQAYALLEAEASAQSLIEDLFGAPKMLPQPLVSPVSLAVASPEETQPATAASTSEPLALALSPPTKPKDHVMVAVDVSAEGKPGNIDVVSAFPEKTEQMEKRARRTLAESRFRPRFENGAPVKTKALPVKVLMN